MEEEKRKAFRVKSSLTLQYCFDTNSENKKWDITTVKDLSESGVRFQAGKSFEVGSLIRLRFKIPSRPYDQTEIDAKVISCQNLVQSSLSMIRAEFVNLSDETLALLREYVLWMVKNQELK
jgi:c-di-GMP-binding flagellar brake protein YcgR